MSESGPGNGRGHTAPDRDFGQSQVSGPRWLGECSGASIAGGEAPARLAAPAERRNSFQSWLAQDPSVNGLLAVCGGFCAPGWSPQGGSHGSPGRGHREYWATLGFF